MRDAAEQAKLGGLLLPEQLQDIRDSLRAARTLQVSVARLKDRMPLWWQRLESLPDCRAVEDEVDRCIGHRGEVLDAASPLLERLRAQVRQAHDRLTERLYDIMNSSRARTTLQEPLITLRGGRYVMPVKADFRGEFRGIVHDVSASGATLFMEPLETVELGNQWRQLQIEEEREVDRVLRQLSVVVGDYSLEIGRTVEILAAVDLALAKAKYGRVLRGIRPWIGESVQVRRPLAGDDDTRGHPQVLRLLDARHPLLTGNVVPTTLRLGDDFTALVITGPNTGGKTVALKTAGLMVLMAQAGMPVPVAEGSVIPIYSEVFADIGDEQSIEQSLSTFSSHMRTIIRILEAAREDCLVLLDELAAGTDPTEGAALGRAVLLYLLERRIPVVATTHHSDLKAFAHETPGVQNASVEFDSETLAPTFRLSIGLPGRSNAIAIAERLGLPPEVVAEARSSLHAGGQEVEGLLTQIQRERDTAERERQAVQAARRAAEDERAEWLARLEEIQQQRDELVAQARRELAAEVEALRASLRQAAQDIQRALRERRREQLMVAGRALQEAETALETPRWQPERRRRRAPEAGPRLVPGERVRLRGLGQVGEIVSVPETVEDELVEVQVGSFRAKVRPDQLEAASGPTLEAGPPAYGWSYAGDGAAEPTTPELHLRGLRVEQALERLEEYLDDAFRSGLPLVRVVHGKGTGAMRRAVREVLGRHALVRSFESAPQEGGGDGVTIAYLNQ